MKRVMWSWAYVVRLLGARFLNRQDRMAPIDPVPQNQSTIRIISILEGLASEYINSATLHYLVEVVPHCAKIPLPLTISYEPIS